MIDHLRGCVAVGACPSPTAHRRLEEAHTFWHRCFDAYQDSDLFRTDLNACIQALRNVTFALQKEMAHVEGFAEWYRPWQSAMRKSDGLLWLLNARNFIVKEGDLETESEAIAWLVLNYFDAAEVIHRSVSQSNLKAFRIDARPTWTAEEVNEALRKADPPQSLLDDGIVLVERRWISKDLPGHELLNVLAYGFSFTSSLVLDADVQFTPAPYDPALDPDTIGDEGSPYPQAARPPCMVTTRAARTIQYRFLDGDPDVGGVSRPVSIEPDAHLTRVAVEKYGPHGATFHTIRARSILDLLPSFAIQGRAIIGSGEEHGWFIWFYRGLKQVHVEVMAARDKADKWTLAQRVADVAARLGADGVIEVGEVWLGNVPEPGEPYVHAEDQPDRREGLAVSAELATGEARTIIIQITRTDDGVAFSDPTEVDEPTSNFFAPLRAYWAHHVQSSR